MNAMERRPLLTDRAENLSKEDVKGCQARAPRPPLRSSISYDQLPSSVSGYFGENYHCIITSPRGSRSKNNDENKESSSESTQLIPEVIQRQKRRPFFIYTVSLIELIILVYSCAAGGVEKVGITREIKYEDIAVFGYINNQSQAVKETVGIYKGVNIFIGPNASFLVRLGAMFPPCMREDRLIADSIDQRKKKEKSLVCCSLNRECGMMNKSSCLYPHKIIGNQTTCTPDNNECSSGITLRPCCLGLHAECEIMSKDKCAFIKGHWHKDKVLCSDVNCLDHTCGMTGAEQKHGNQGYRLVTAIFIHIGILHLIANLLFQVFFGAKIEIEIGTVRTALIYLISGLGGNLVSAIFTPLLPEVGASGALYGFLALILVWYIRYCRMLRKPFWDLCILITIILISFAMGTLPYIGNFVHIGGFLFGLLTSILLLPRKSCEGVIVEHFWRYWISKGIALSSLITLTVAGFILLYSKNSNFCSECKYIDCIHWTDNFCPDMHHDGFLNTDES